MRLMIYFFAEHWRGPHHLRTLVYGRYSRVGFAFSDKGKLFLYGTTQGEVFARHERGEALLCHEEGKLDLLLPDLDAATVDAVFRTCEACAQAKLPFNLQDLLMMHVLQTADDPRLFDCPKLHNAQAVILILRECLPAEHELRAALNPLNSRFTLPETLYDRIALYCLPVFNSRDFSPPNVSDRRLGGQRSH